MSSSPRRPGLDAASLLAGALCLMAGAPCLAQDAAALPTTDPTAQTRDLQLEVFLNGAATDLIVPFRQDADGVTRTGLEQLRRLGFKVEGLTPDAEGRVRLDRAPGVTYRYDEPRQAIFIDAAPEALQPLHIDASGRRPTGELTPTATGAVLNYTAFGSAGGVRGLDGIRYEGLAAAFDARVFGRFGAVNHGFVTRTGSGLPMTTLRLDTTWTYVVPEKMLGYRAGDLITRGPSWSRPVRLGGFQVSRRFDLRPDIVTTPLPTISGAAAAPSTLELYVNNVRALSTQVPTGPYQIDQAPMVHGAGVAQVILRDALGRETVQSLPFYVSPELLAPGFSDFSAEVGLARRYYGTLSGDYDDRPAASGSVRYGLSDRLTVEGHAEASEGFGKLGGGGSFLIGRFGAASLGFAGSRTNEGGAGGLVEASIEARSRSYAVNLRTQRTMGDYEDLASWTAPEANARLTRTDFRTPREIDHASVSLPLPVEGGRVGLSYTSLRQRKNEEAVRAAGVTWNQEFRRARLYATAMREMDRDEETSVYVGLAVPLAREVTATVGGSSTRRGDTVFADAARQMGSEQGSTSWRVRVAEGAITDRRASASYVAGFGRLAGGVHQTDGDAGVTGQIEGSAAFVGGRTFLARRVDGAFAVVDAGMPGVPVRHENRRVGRTDRRGVLLVPDLVAYQHNRISLDPVDLPVDADVPQTKAVVTPTSLGGAVVKLGLQATHAAALVTFLDRWGAPVETGASGRLVGSDETFVVGYDGQAYVRGLSRENVAQVETAAGETCRATFAYARKQGEQVRVTAVCRTGTSFAGGQP